MAYSYLELKVITLQTTLLGMSIGERAPSVEKETKWACVYTLQSLFSDFKFVRKFYLDVNAQMYIKIRTSA